MKRVLLAIAAIVTLANAPLAAQQSAAPGADSLVIRQMKAALRNLITAQEQYWADHGTYTSDGKALGTYPYANAGPLVQVFTAGSRGWSGIATHRALKGKSCVVWVGQSADIAGGLPKTMGGRPAGKEGEPVCDEP